MSLNLTDEHLLFLKVFFPHFHERRESALNGGRFAHYTSAEAAMHIIQSNSLWMRNAITMNDFMEIQYGMKCLSNSYNQQEEGLKFKALLEEIRPGIIDSLANSFNGWLPHFQENTYLTSMSEHDPSEDRFGRLSMWRAYGSPNSVALVIKNTPFMNTSDALKAYSSPVHYIQETEYPAHFSSLVGRIEENKSDIKALPFDQLLGWLFTAFRFELLCTKHPGFKEEREWRIAYAPTMDASPAIQKDMVVIRGVPQEIHKIPLINKPELGLFGADIPSLIDRIIIGPSAQPLTLLKAFVQLLSDAGVEDAANKVIVSDIPLRQ